MPVPLLWPQTMAIKPTQFSFSFGFWRKKTKTSTSRDWREEGLKGKYSKRQVFSFSIWDESWAIIWSDLTDSKERFGAAGHPRSPSRQHRALQLDKWSATCESDYLTRAPHGQEAGRLYTVHCCFWGVTSRLPLALLSHSLSPTHVRWR